MPMLADFATRLACGLAVVALATPGRVVPPTYFRTQCQVILGLLVLSALEWSRVGAPGPSRVQVLVVVAAVLAFGGSVAWGLGLPRVAIPLTVGIASATAAALTALSRAAEPAAWALDAIARLASAVLLGSTLAAMLLGHHYLTAPAMSIDPLRRLVHWSAWSLVFRAALALLGGGLEGNARAVSTVWLAMRWGMGFAGAGLALVLAAKTVAIRSTQSATGILYVAMTLVLVGELTALILSRGQRMIF
jgi:hypothetical protein